MAKTILDKMNDVIVGKAFCLKEGCGAGNYYELMGRIGYIHPNQYFIAEQINYLLNPSRSTFNILGTRYKKKDNTKVGKRMRVDSFHFKDFEEYIPEQSQPKCMGERNMPDTSVKSGVAFRGRYSGKSKKKE
jgi:hypothetical protein